MPTAERIVVEAREVEKSTQLEKVLNLSRTVHGGIEPSAKTKGMRTECLEVTEVDLELIEVRGMPKIQERVMFHRASKTLIVADLLFNLQAEAGRWTLGFMRAMAGIREYPGMSRLFRFCIKDRSAFAASMREIAALDFERIVVAHGEPIVEDANRQFLNLMATHGFDIGGV